MKRVMIDFGGDFGGRGMGPMGRFSAEDIEAFTDARIAALHAGLKLSSEQERMWPPVEQAIRDLVKLRREQFRAWRERREGGGDPRDDLPGFLRGMAERQGARAEALRKLADAAGPLYASFDDGQKRRLRLLVRHMRPGGMMRHAWRHRDGEGRGDRDFGDFGERGFGERGFRDRWPDRRP
jgi:zinc resistance-associated protein